MAGAPVTVWGEHAQPRQAFITYYTDVLNKIGFKATTKVIADAQYFPTIGNLKLNPQTGFADWNQDFPNPSDFYLLMDAKSIQPTNNQNFSQVNDPKCPGRAEEAQPRPRVDSSTRWPRSGRRSTPTWPRRRTSSPTATSWCRSSCRTR